MNREHWSSDQKEILELINAAIDGNFRVTLQRDGGSPLRSRIVKIHYHRSVPYILLERPAELYNSRKVQDLLFKMRGLPILGFSCPITREGDNLLITMLPKTIFQLELRENQRQFPMKGSMATFFIRDRSRVSICMMENISMGGIKLTGTPSHSVEANDVIGPCTVSLAGRDALISREVTINKAIVTRAVISDGKGSPMQVGIKFDLSEYEGRQLQEHLDFFQEHNRKSG